MMIGIKQAAEVNPSSKIEVGGESGGFSISFWRNQTDGELTDKITITNCRTEWEGDFQGITAEVVSCDDHGPCGRSVYSSFNKDSGKLTLGRVMNHLRFAQQKTANPDYNWHS